MASELTERMRQLLFLMSLNLRRTLFCGKLGPGSISRVMVKGWRVNDATGTYHKNIIKLIYKLICTDGSKILFTSKGGRFCVENDFLQYLNLYYVNSAYHKLKTFLL